MQGGLSGRLRVHMLYFKQTCGYEILLKGQCIMKLTIGEKIAILRKEKNVTQTELAEYLYLAPQTVSRWEVGSGAPEISLLPKIAAFFGVSIDELFGLTSLERTADLVCKYSVLRDDSSFKEAMDYIDSQLLTIEAVMKNAGEDSAELKRDLEQLEAEKMHMWIQQGREAFQRAFSIADEFVKKTEHDPENPWYLPMRLQRDQLCDNTGRGREALAERREDYEERPDSISLLRYLAMLGSRQEYEAILDAVGGSRAEKLLFPPREENLSSWQEVMNAAAKLGGREFIERYLPPVLEACSERDEMDFLLLVMKAYEGESLDRAKARVRELLPKAGLNEYFEDKVRERLE